MSGRDRPLTYRDLEHFPDDGKRREIIDGDLYVFAAPARPHQELLVRFVVLLGTHPAVLAAGRVFIAPVDVRLGENQVQPDLIVMRHERLDRYRGHVVDGPPDLILEILSPSNHGYDEVEKARIYAAAGVPEYWLADPLAPAFRPFVLQARRYEPVPLAANGTYHSPTLPGLRFDPTPLLAGLDV